MNRWRAWPKRVAIALDQLVNAICFGDEDETISSRAAKARIKGQRWGCVLCALLDRLQADHCDSSLEADEGRRIVRADLAPAQPPPQQITDR